MPFCDGDCGRIGPARPDLLKDAAFLARAEENYAGVMRAIGDKLTPTNHIGFVFGFGHEGETLRDYCKGKLREAGYRVANNYEWAQSGFALHVFGKDWNQANPACPPPPTSADRIGAGRAILPEDW